MRILLLVDAYYPSRKAQAKLIHDLGAELHRRGHDVTILSSSETIPGPLDIRHEEGLTVVRVRTGNLKDVPRVIRAVREERLSAALWSGAERFFRERPCELVVYYSPTIFFGSLVRRLKALWGCRSYLILRDIFPEWAVDAGLLRRDGLIHRFFRLREEQQYAAADVIGVQSPKNLDYMARRFPDWRDDLEVLYNWAALDEGELPKENHRARLGVEGKVVFFYGGNIGVAQDIDNIVQLARRLRSDERIFFLLTGDGTETERLANTIASERLTNIRWRAGVDQREYLSLLSEMDVGIISLDRRLRTENYPGKMLGYMQFKLPILASINPGNELKGLIERFDAGRVSENGDDDALCRHAVELAADAALRARLGENGRKLLEERFSAAAAAGQILRSARTESRRSPRPEVSAR